MSIVFGKSFCSWLCPVGLISELVGDFGEKIFKRKLRLPKILDYPLRSLKYLLLGFLFYSVFFLMTELALKAFLDSPYNLVSDVKMFYFFANISRTSLIVLTVLFVLSIFVRNFWCRFLCPYGALLGIFALLSPTKIKRNTGNCIDCELCTKACPSFIKVDKIKTVVSDECTSCLNCVDVCPVADTLELKTITPIKSIKVTKRVVAIGVVSIFLLVTGAGIFTGNWQNNMTAEEYLFHYERMNSYSHPTGTSAMKELNKKASRNKKLNEIDQKNKVSNPPTNSGGE